MTTNRPAASALPSHVDPDVMQAVEDLRPVAAQLRTAQAALRTANNGCPNLKDVGAARGLVADLVGRIRVRAERIGISADGLHWLLREEGNLRQRTRSKRKPTRDQLGKALYSASTIADSDLLDAKAELERAQKAVERQERAALAAGAAILIFGSMS